MPDVILGYEHIDFVLKSYNRVDIDDPKGHIGINMSVESQHQNRNVKRNMSYSDMVKSNISTDKKKQNVQS